MQTAPRMEIEAKYTVPDRIVFARLLGLESLGDYTLRPRLEQQIADRYLDTPDRALLRAGFACRIREGSVGDRWIVTVKGLGGSHGAVHQRQEHEIEVPPGAAPVEWPASSARDLVLSHAGETALAELFTLHQHRTTREVWNGERHVAVLSLDRVEIGAGPEPLVSQEMEIELTPAGGVDDLHLMGKLLRPFGLHPQPHSKFERALALFDAGRHDLGAGTATVKPASHTNVEPRPAKPGTEGGAAKRKKKGPGIVAEDPMAEAGRKILQFHFEKMLAKEDGTRLGTDIEELHDMRVATRRQRAALRIVAPFFRRKSIRPLQEGLRTVAQLLGAVRDLDVLLDAARRDQSELPPADARALQPLLDTWSRRRDAARLELLAHLDSPGWISFKDVSATFLSTPGEGAKLATDGATPRPTLVSQVLPTEVWSHYGAIRAFDTGLQWASVETLHELRIEGKRLRYVLEFFREVLDPCVEQTIVAIVALQDLLGELHDADVTIGLIREFLAGPEAASQHEVAAAAGGYLERREARLRELRHALPRPWRGVTGRRFKLSLSRAVAAL